MGKEYFVLVGCEVKCVFVIFCVEVYSQWNYSIVGEIKYKKVVKGFFGLIVSIVVGGGRLVRIDD